MSNLAVQMSISTSEKISHPKKKGHHPRRGDALEKLLHNQYQGRTNRRNAAKTSVDRNTKITLTLTIAGLY